MTPEQKLEKCQELVKKWGYRSHRDCTSSCPVSTVEARVTSAIMKCAYELQSILHDHDKTAENPAENAGEGPDFARTEKE